MLWRVEKISDQKIQPLIVWTVFLLTTGILLALRSPDQLLNPYVWTDDGVVTLKDFIEHGPLSAFYTVQGYFILISKLVSSVTLWSSLKYYPVIANWITFALTLCILCCIWKAPTKLNGKAFCALAVLLHPTGGNLYLMPGYLFWFAALLAPLALLWKEDANTPLQRKVRADLLL